MADEIQVLDFNDYMKKPVKVQATKLTEDTLTTEYKKKIVGYISKRIF